MIRIATVGTSWITEHFARAVTHTEGITLAGVYSRDPGRAHEFSRTVQAPGSWSNYQQMLDSRDVDAVYVASPNSAHYDQTLAALRADKHVIVEKPATVTAAQFQALVDEARSRGLVLMEAMRSAYDPGTARIRDLLPKLGQLRLGSLSYCQRSSRYDQVLAGEPVNIFDPKLGGGALLDLGIYCISMMVDLFGTPQSTSGNAIMLPTGADGAGVATARYADQLVELTFSKITASNAPNVIQGELGTLSFDSVAAPRRFELRLGDGTTEGFSLGLPQDNMAYEVAHFVKLVQGLDCESDWKRTLDSLSVLDQLRAGMPN